jgi:predicted oxidoreductase
MAEKYNVTNTAIAIAWILRHPAHMQPIIGTTNVQRVKDISKASGITLSRADWYEIYLAAGNKLP